MWTNIFVSTFIWDKSGLFSWFCCSKGSSSPLWAIIDIRSDPLTSRAITERHRDSLSSLLAQHSGSATRRVLRPRAADTHFLPRRRTQRFQVLRGTYEQRTHWHKSEWWWWWWCLIYQTLCFMFKHLWQLLQHQVSLGWTCKITKLYFSFNDHILCRRLKCAHPDMVSSSHVQPEWFYWVQMLVLKSLLFSWCRCLFKKLTFNQCWDVEGFSLI